MSKDEICTCKACKNPVFHCQICKFVRFLLPSSSWLLKLPNAFRGGDHEDVTLMTCDDDADDDDNDVDRAVFK